MTLFRSHFGFLFDFCDLHVSRYRLWQGRDRDPARHLDDGYPRYFDRQGFPIPADGTEPSVLRWARIREEAGIDAVRVAYDELPDGSFLSTVWLGLDHNYCFGPPHIFETMRFSGETHTFTMADHEYQGRKSLEFPDPDGELVDQLRYTTEEEALAAHHAIVRLLRLREGH